MKRILTVEQMRKADAYTIQDKNIPAETLMERAGRALAELVENTVSRGEILCVCGGGNNGGDGFVCARLLLGKGYDVTAVCFATRKSELCEKTKKSYELAGGKTLETFPDKAFDLVVDCLLGTGTRGEIKAEYAKAIERINAYKACGAKVVSADIPSGLNGDNGKATVCVLADKTLCIGERKAGVYFGDGMDFSGELVDADIGIALPQDRYITLIEKQDVARILPRRKRNTHKGTYGKTAIVGGSDRFVGAPYLATLGALRSGAGYTYLYAPKSTWKGYALHLPEAIVAPVKIDGKHSLQAVLDKQAVAYGMGLGVSKRVSDGAKYLLQNYKGKLLLDADAINALAKYEKDNLSRIFTEKKCEVVLTPHVKEFARISGQTIEEILDKGACSAVEFAKTHGVIVVLKNAVTTVTDGEEIAVNVAGSAGQAKGGSGDALSGVITALMGQGVAPLDSVKAGVYLLGSSASILEREQGQYSMLATDVINGLGRVFVSLYDNE